MLVPIFGYLVLHSHSSSVRDVECSELNPLVERLHPGPAGHHRAPPAGCLGTGGIPPHRHRWDCGKEPSWQLPGSLPHPQHPPADPYAALVQTRSCTHGHRRLPAIQVSCLQVWKRIALITGKYNSIKCFHTAIEHRGVKVEDTGGDKATYLGLAMM